MELTDDRMLKWDQYVGHRVCVVIHLVLKCVYSGKEPNVAYLILVYE